MSFKSSFHIEAKSIGKGHPCYMVAEMSANHGQDLGRAKEIVHAAKESGADAIKLQSYRADTMTMKSDLPHFYITEGPWKGQYLYDLYEYAFMPWDFHAELFELAKKLEITCFSTPFDMSSVELLEELGCPAYKIASPELIDLDLIERVANTGKPLIISTGGGTLTDIADAVNKVNSTGLDELCLLKCTAEYPAPVDQINLATMQNLADTFQCPAGFSDHTLGIHIPLAAAAQGAALIEKHFMLDDAKETADSFFSATPEQFSSLVKQVRDIESAQGQVHYPAKGSNKRRCVYLKKALNAGDTLSQENLTQLRPGEGEISPKDIPRLIGRKVKLDLPLGTQLKWEHLV